MVAVYISFHRLGNVVWCMSRYMIQPEHMTILLLVSVVTTHARHVSVMDEWEDVEFVVKCWRRSQYSRIRDVPRVSTLTTEQGHIVAALVYHTSFYAVVGRGLTMECWLDAMFSVRAKLYSTYVSEDCGLFYRDPYLDFTFYIYVRVAIWDY